MEAAAGAMVEARVAAVIGVMECTAVPEVAVSTVVALKAAAMRAAPAKAVADWAAADRAAVSLAVAMMAAVSLAVAMTAVEVVADPVAEMLAGASVEVRQ